jgi:L-alanine-DL-glutamate epimerase-like enolase superfamily enzyme
MESRSSEHDRLGMKITGVTTTILCYERSDPMADALNFILQRYAVLVHIRTDEGLSGIGESAYFGGPPEITARVIEDELGPLLVGEQATEIERLWSKMYHRSMQHGRRGIVISAMSGIDIALWDLLGKALDAPLHQILGTYRTRLRTYASGGFYRVGQTAEDLADEAAEYVRRGFRGVKVKVGRNPFVPLNPLELMNDRFCFHTVEEDLARVRAVRARIGEDVQLMVDANSGWDVATSLRAMSVLADLGVAWLEEPLFPEDVVGSARLVAHGAVPIAGYETAQGRFSFNELVTKRAVDIVQPDATWSGGISECRRIAALASAHNLSCAPHAFGSAVGLAANAHLLASLPNGLVLEIDQTPNPLREELLVEPLTIDESGMCSVPGGPGLGVVLNDDVVARYQV